MDRESLRRKLFESDEWAYVKDFLAEALDEAMQQTVMSDANDPAQVAKAQAEVRVLAMIVGPDLKEALYAEIASFEKQRQEQESA